MSKCTVAHPDQPDVVCSLPAGLHPSHLNGRHAWPHEEWVDPLPPVPKAKGKQRLLDIKDAMKKPDWSGAREGIVAADQHANPDWKAEAYNAVVWCSSHYEVFTADEVWERLGASGVEVRTHNPSALGPIMLKASREGVIVKTDEKKSQSARSSNHRDMVIWMAAGQPEPDPQPLTHVLRHFE